MLYIGIDLGTSAVKLLLMNEKGKILNIVSKEYPLHIPQPNWSEQNPEDWWNGVIEGIKELTTDYNKADITGIGVGGQMHGLVVLDKNDKVIRPAILWNDSRTTAETDYLNNEIGKERLSQYTGNIAFTGFTAPKILWLKNNEPENFSKINKIMLPKDYIVYKLTGVHSCDYSDASGMLLLDVKNKCWSKEMLEICSISEKQLPQLFESYEKVGNIQKSIAEKLSLAEGCIVVAGAGDNAAAAIGTGTFGNGKCNISLGTSGTVFISPDSFRLDENNALHAFAHADGYFHLMGCMLCAASCNKWWVEDILQSNDYTTTDSEITALGENRVFFLPYLMGERSPINDPYAKGTFIGLSLDTKRKDITQAIYEGVAFALRDCLEIARELGIEINSSTICGGGSKSKLWVKIIANVLNIDIVQLKSEQGPALGGALLAAYGNGEYKSLEDGVKQTLDIAHIEKPDIELVEKYNECYSKYKKIYPALKNVFKEL